MTRSIAAPDTDSNLGLERDDLTRSPQSPETNNPAVTKFTTNVGQGVNAITSSVFQQPEGSLEQQVAEGAELLEMLPVDFSRAQLAEIAKAIVAGASLEIETWGPYLMDYDVVNGTLDPEKLTHSDQIGLEIAQGLSGIIPEYKIVSLIDDYHSGVPDFGQGRASGEGFTRQVYPQLPISTEARLNFRGNVQSTLEERGIIDGKEKQLISLFESERAGDADKMITQLRNKGMIEEQPSGRIDFVNPAATDPKYRRITLKTAHGKYVCYALDAAAYINNPKNFQDTVHLIILPAQQFLVEQDTTFALLEALGMKPKNYHNIFYDKGGDPVEITNTITTALQGAIDQVKVAVSEESGAEELLTA